MLRLQLNLSTSTAKLRIVNSNKLYYYLPQGEDYYTEITINYIKYKQMYEIYYYNIIICISNYKLYSYIN